MGFKNFIITCLIGFAVAVRADLIQINVGKTVGKINHALAGVSQGGNAGSYFKPEVIAGLEKLTPEFVRIEMITSSLPHHLYNSTTGKFDWEKLDYEIEAIQKGGGKIIINFFGTPEHLVSNSAAPIPAFTPPRDFKVYADFCAEIVRHVNLEKNYNVKLWEFWNEPSGNHFWTDWHRGNRRFFELWNEVYRAVKKVDPSVKMGGFGDNSQYPEHYEAWFDFARKSNTMPDFLTIHYYGDWAGSTSTVPADYARFSDRLLGICKKKLGTTLPVYYTEWNLPAESVGKFPAERVAAWIGASLCEMQKNGRINGAAFFRVEHYRDPYSSLFDSEGTPRTAFRILRFFDAMPEQALAVLNNSPSVSATAAGNSEEINVLIARYDGSNGAVTTKADINLSGIVPSRDYSIELIRENKENAPKIGEGSPERFTLQSSASGTIVLPLQLDPFETVMIRVCGGNGDLRN
ncbi:MAG: cellulase family glycosylhydrolase [Lentisphaeria bacterium]|nr:cellulase family glycosylhydrolase [Lentisphaeria bacterium]